MMFSQLLEKKKIIFLLSILPFLIWFLLSLTIMRSYVENWTIVVVLFFGTLLSVATAMRERIAKIISIIILGTFTLYFIYEGIDNPYFAFAYPIFLIVIWLYYLILNYISRRRLE